MSPTLCSAAVLSYLLTIFFCNTVQSRPWPLSCLLFKFWLKVVIFRLFSDTVATAMELEVWGGDWGVPSVDYNCLIVMVSITEFFSLSSRFGIHTPVGDFTFWLDLSLAGLRLRKHSEILLFSHFMQHMFVHNILTLHILFTKVHDHTFLGVESSLVRSRVHRTRLRLCVTKNKSL